MADIELDGYRVLHVEDSLADAALLHVMLPEERFDVHTATSLAEAISMLDGGLEPHIGIIDLNLPDAIGLECPRRILAHPDSPPLIVLSGQVDDDLITQSLRLGVDDVLQKEDVATPRILDRVLLQTIERAGFRAALDAQSRAVQGSNEQLRAVVEQMAHDLRNPLVAVRGYAQALGRAELDDDLRDTLINNLAGVAEQSLQMLDGMLLDVGQFAGRERVPMTEVVGWVCDILEHEFVATGASIVVEELPSVWGYTSSLRQAVLNVVHNSLRHRRPEIPPRLTVRAAQTDDGHRIIFSDNGPGVPKAKLDGIFLIGDVDPALKGYSALGLASVRSVMTRHNGTAAVQLNARGGLEVSLTFPRRMRRPTPL